MTETCYTQEVWTILSCCDSCDGLFGRGSLVLKQITRLYWLESVVENSSSQFMSHKTGIRGHLVATRDSHEGEPDLEKKIELRRKDGSWNNPRRGSGCGGNS